MTEVLQKGIRGWGGVGGGSAICQASKIGILYTINTAIANILAMSARNIGC